MTTTLVMTPIAFAESTTVINNVSVSASTGGNSANGGVIKEGVSKAGIFIKTIVNGETVEYIDEEVKSSGDEEVKIEKETHYEGDETKTEAKATVNMSGRTKEITQSANSQTDQAKIQDKEVEKSNSEVVSEKPSLVAIIFQKLINYVLSIFRI